MQPCQLAATRPTPTFVGLVCCRMAIAFLTCVLLLLAAPIEGEHESSAGWDAVCWPALAEGAGRGEAALGGARHSLHAGRPHRKLKDSNTPSSDAGLSSTLDVSCSGSYLNDTAKCPKPGWFCNIKQVLLPQGCVVVDSAPTPSDCKSTPAPSTTPPPLSSPEQPVDNSMAQPPPPAGCPIGSNPALSSNVRSSTLMWSCN